MDETTSISAGCENCSNVFLSTPSILRQRSPCTGRFPQSDPSPISNEISMHQPGTWATGSSFPWQHLIVRMDLSWWLHWTTTRLVRVSGVADRLVARTDSVPDASVRTWGRTDLPGCCSGRSWSVAVFDPWSLLKESRKTYVSVCFGIKASTSVPPIIQCHRTGHYWYSMQDKDDEFTGSGVAINGRIGAADWDQKGCRWNTSIPKSTSSIILRDRSANLLQVASLIGALGCAKKKKKREKRRRRERSRRGLLSYDHKGSSPVIS